MEYPGILKPTSLQSFVLSTGEEISVAKTSPKFEKWSGERFQNAYGGKTVLNIGGEPFFAELAILRAFQNDGWEGVWVDSYRDRFRTIWEGLGVDLPPEKQSLLDKIRSASTSQGGCWDVFCWKNDDVVFVEAKLLGKDRIRSSQVNWLEASLECGVNESSFLLVEWAFA